MIGAIEQAMIDAVKAASDAGTLGYRLRQVESLGDELDGQLAAVVKNFPAVWFTFAGEPRPTQEPDGRWLHEPVFVAVVGVANRRNERSRRHGTDGDAGSYQILEDVRALLAGQQLGLAIRPIEPGAVRSLQQGKGASIYAHELHTAYWSAEGEPAVLGSFETFHADWDVPAHGNVTAPLPAAAPDASDILTLEGDDT